MRMNTGGGYLKAKDVKNGEVIKFLDEGRWEASDKFKYESGDPVQNCIFKVEYQGDEKQYRINKASRVAMIEAFGDESKDWVGKQATMMVIPTPNGNDKMIVLQPIADNRTPKQTKTAWDEEDETTNNS